MHAKFLTCLLLFYLVLHMLIPQPYRTRGLHTEKHFNFGCKVFCGQLIITHENFSVFLDHFFLVLKGTVYDSNVSLLQINRSFDDNFQTAHALPAAVFSGRYGGAMTS